MEVDAGRKATLVLASNVLGAALGYASLLLIGRYFEPSAYGAYLFAASATGLVGVLSNLGIGTAHQRHLAQGLDPGRGLGVLLRLRLLVVTPVLAVLLLAYLAWTATHDRPLTDATTPAVLGLALALQLLSGSRQALLDTWQGQQRVGRVETVRTLDNFLVAFFLGNAALLAAELDGRWQPVPGVGPFWAHVLGLSGPLDMARGALLLASCYVGARALSLLVALGWGATDRMRVGPWDRGLARSYWRTALPFALAGALALVLQTTDATLLGFFWTAREVGLYGAAQRLSTLCLIASNAVGPVLFNRFSQLHALGEAGAGTAGRLFAKGQRYLMLMTAPLAAAMLALPAAGLHVAVGDGYLEAALPLALLGGWAFVTTAEMPLGVRLMGDGHGRMLVRSAGLNASLNVALNLLFIPRQGLGLGPTGAALATLLSTSASYVYLRAQGRRAYGLPWVSADQVRIVAAALAAAAFWMGAFRLLGTSWFDRSWELIGWGVLGMAVYALALLLVGELHGRDIHFLRRAAHPKALLDELKGR